MCHTHTHMANKADSDLFVRQAVAHVLQILGDVVHVGEAEEDASEVFLADGGQALAVGEELDLEHLRLQVVHEPGGARRRR